ncbi:MAG: HAD-IA family hydrolase [Candidatus Omnitrophica bacterium]|nr:HAD-IA family hydrolase [Candidatus Omnitrophota bacterium]
MTPKARKKLIVYDLDGTLVDTRGDIVQAVAHTLRRMGAPALSREEILPFVGRGLRQMVAGFIKSDDPGRVEQAMKIYRDYYAEHLLDQSRLYPGAKAVLDHFKKRNQAVVTNKPNPFSRQILEGLGVADRFFAIIAGDTEYPHKPDPASLASLMGRSRASPEATLMVGDSVIDIATGKAAAAATVVLTHGFDGEAKLKAARPDHLVANFGELLRLAKREGW